MRTLFRNVRLIDPSRDLDGAGSLIVADGLIEWSGLGKPGTQVVDRVVDGGGCVLAPGLVDLHVHFRDPGQTRKETLETGCRAAAAGGFTAVVTMANTCPPIDSPERVRDILARSRSLDCRIYPAATVTRAMKGDELTDFEALVETGVPCVTDDGLTVERNDVAMAAFERAAELGLPVSVHPEAPGLGGDRSVNRGAVSRHFGLEGVPALAEELDIARYIMLAEVAGVHLHVQHVSSAPGVALVARAKASGLNVTGEATPHHMALTERAILRSGADAKMSPPLRTETDRQAVRRALLAGVLDVVASDHAPHCPDEKATGLLAAPNGVIGLETSLAVCLTELSDDPTFSMSLLIDRMSTRPCRIFDLPGGTLAVGAAADLVIFDPTEVWTVEPEKFQSKGRNCPWNAQQLAGRVKMTVLAGRTTWRDAADVRFASC